MVDPKKFIAFFLLVASLTSLVMAILLGTEGRRGNQAPTFSQELNQGVANPVPGNAFVESVPNIQEGSEREEVVIKDEDLPQVNYSSNLTENLAEQLTREVVRNNPTGPEAEGDTYNLITPPDGAMERIGRLSLLGTDWNETTEKPDLKIARNPTREDEVSYLRKVDEIVGGLTAGEEFKNLNSQSPSWEMVIATQLILGETKKKLEGVLIPQSMISLHEKILAAVLNQQKIFESFNTYEEDPMKTWVVFENADQIIDQDLIELSKEFEKLNLPEEVLGLRNGEGSLPFLAKFLGIKEAKAQLWVPTDCVGFQCIKKLLIAIKDLAQKVWEWGRKFATEQLKDRLVKSMVRKTINWIQGGSKPKFVEDWNDFLRDSADRAAGYVISNIEPRLCRSFGPLVKVLLYPPESTRGSSLQIRTQCTLSQVIQNIDNFRANFADGGWIGYAYALKPQNNLFGTLIEVGDISLREAERAREAASDQAKAGQGFTTDKVCGNTRNHNVSEIWDYMYGPPAPGYAGSEGDAIFIAEQIGEDYVPDTFNSGSGNFQTCPPSAWENTTPGSAVAHSLYTALDSPLHRIVNAQDLIDLASALVNSALNKLMEAGAEGLRNLRTGQRTVPGTPGLAPATSTASICNGINPGPELNQCLADLTTIDTTVIQNQASTTPGVGNVQACEGLSGQALQDCINQASGNSSSSPPGQPNNTPPTLTISGPSDTTVNGISPMTLTITGHDPDVPPGSTIMVFKIDWGDGTVTPNITQRNEQAFLEFHNYTQPASGFQPITRTISIFVTDISGATSTASKVITVWPPGFGP